MPAKVTTNYSQGNPEQSISGIQQSRNIVRNVSEDQEKLIEPAFRSSNAIIQQAKALVDEYGESTKGSSEALKLLKEYLNELLPAVNSLNNALTLGSANTDEMAKALATTDSTTQDLLKVMDLYKKSLDSTAEKTKKLTKDQKEQLKKQQEDRERLLKAELTGIKEIHKTQSELDKKRIKDYEKELKNANRSMSKEISKSLHDTLGNITDVMQKLDVHKLSKALEPTSKMLLQRDYQLDNGISSKEFNTFKKELYSSIDSNIYSDEQILQSFDTLSKSYKHTSEVTPQLLQNIIDGQQILGMSSEQQSQLLKRSNYTGRDQLAFYQGFIAKYATSSLGLSRQQLTELTSLNNQFSQQAFEYGIDSEAFDEMVNKNTAVFEALGVDSSMIKQSMMNMTSNLTNAAALFGTTSDQLAERFSNGEDYLSMIMTNNSPLMQQLRSLYNQGPSGWNKAKTIMQENFGSMLDDATLSTIHQVLKNEDKINSLLSTAGLASSKDASKAMEEEKDYYEDSVTLTKKIANSVEKFFSANTDWPLMGEITGIATTVTYIASILTASGLQDLLKGGKNFLSNIKDAGSLKAFLANKGVGTGLSSGTWATVGSGGKGIAGAGMGTSLLAGGLIAGGAAWGVADAISMQGSTGKGGLADSARGFFLGTGSAQKSSSENTKSALGNTGKYALIGAGIGTFFGPGLGTAIGAGIGGVIGGLTSLIGMKMDDQRAVEEQQLQQQKAIAQNTYKTADNVTWVTQYKNTRTTSNVSDGPGGDLGVGGDYSEAMNNHKVFSHGAYHPVQGHQITSWYGYRKALYRDGKQISKEGLHSGIDLGAKEGTSLGAPYDGVVSYNGWWGSGGNTIGITDGNGYTHTFMHMKSKGLVPVGKEVKAGQLVGYVGHTGGNYASHLHYSVSNGPYSHANTVDPYSWLLNASIFNPTGNALYTPDTTDTSGNQAGLDSVSTALTDTGSHLDTAMLKTLGVGGDSIVDSIHNLRDTIIGLNDTQKSQKELMNLLTNARTSPTY